MSRTPLRTVLPVALGAALLAGCVRRTIDITSEPSGAMVVLNEREVGRTPVTVEFTYYGTYDVRLALDGHEPLLTSGEAVPPLWDNVPLDFVAEALPARLDSTVRWHYVLEPARDAGLLERARELKAEAEGQAAARTGS
ncbi:MAG TPA: PEGA domain-containing protein [Phycisphaerales bacterium]|nr:PEGA domain-containing protein [Phycisphaerales bacterium]HMP37592.1 PEGA domain-containing protein [Phycisphaerales bacterium]